MSLRYRLPCDNCGRVHPVETGQAGGVIFCECGTKVKIPSMLKIRRLEPWEIDESDVQTTPSEPSPVVQEGPKAKEETPEPSSVAETRADADVVSSSESQGKKPEKKRRLSPRRRGLFIVASVMFVFSSLFACLQIPKPQPIRVFYKQIDYNLGDGRRIRRDTTPITMEDYNFYFFTDYSDPNKTVYLINDDLIDRMNDFVCMQYFPYVKQLDMSDNFYDNYEALKTKRLLLLSGFGLLALISLVVEFYALFAKEKVQQVGAMRGDNWK
ncbi:MAG: hypothetical protein IJL92_07655 [Thermoguttaceae bacterium]|nr:hypothetical protein [Thermoguttaceae bacterium]